MSAVGKCRNLTWERGWRRKYEITMRKWVEMRKIGGNGEPLRK